MFWTSRTIIRIDMDEYNGLAKGEQISIFHILYKQSHESWKRIPEGALVQRSSPFRKYDEDKRIDYIADGYVNHAPTVIGYTDCVSGPGECFDERIPRYYR